MTRRRSPWSCPMPLKASDTATASGPLVQGVRLGAAVQQGRHRAVRRCGAPDGPILAVRVEDLGEKEAVLAANLTGFFTIPHFDGYSAVLIQLKKVSKRTLWEAIV